LKDLKVDLLACVQLRRLRIVAPCLKKLHQTSILFLVERMTNPQEEQHLDF
jgi:hypothetical protein